MGLENLKGLFFLSISKIMNMTQVKYQRFSLITLVFINLSIVGMAQSIDTAYFVNSSPPFNVKIEGYAFTPNTHITRVEKSTNATDSAFIDIYWVHCLPTYNEAVLYDTTITLDMNLPSTFNLRINSYRDTNTNSSCVLVGSVEHLYFYDVPNNSANVDNLELAEKKIVRIVNLMGKEIDDESNTLMIHIFSDGTRKKVFKVE